MIKAALFDLDGTLLPMDQNKFLKAYFSLMTKKMSKYGYDADKLIKSIWKCTQKMVTNDGSISNRDAFWKAFTEIYGESSAQHIPYFDEYYLNEFQAVKDSCGFDPRAERIVKMLISNGVRVVLATNPLFPAVGTLSRARWAGLDSNDFELITTYENIGYCKPNQAYYKEILSRIGLMPEECIMIGNDVDEDIIPAHTVGMKVFLLTDCLINNNDADITVYPHGNFNALKAHLSRSINE